MTNPTLFEISEGPSLSDVHIERILKNALYSTEIITHIPGSYATMSSRMIPFMLVYHLCFFVDQIHPTPKVKMQLTNNLKAWNMRQQHVHGDGNCCFIAAAFSITKWEEFKDRERDALQLLGLFFSVSIE